MTAPTVARRWADPAPDRVGKPPGAPEAHPVAGGEGRLARRVAGPRPFDEVLREQAVRIRRLVPLAAVLFTALVVHAAVTPHLAVWGAAPDGLLVGVAAVSVSRGPRAGAAFGFVAGLGADLFLATPMGTSALAFTLVGHVLGRSGRPRPSGTAAALCSPASTCFACRRGRVHGAAATATGAGGPGAPPVRARRRDAARRTLVRRSIGLTVLAVGAGRLATAAVATALGGVPFPGGPGLVRLAAVAVISGPVGVPVFAAVGRLPGASLGSGHR